MKTRVHRISNPLMCQYLWDAISTIRNHKQLPSFDRIRRYMSRLHNIETEKVEKYLEEATTDNLIAVTRKVGQKGSKVGIEQEGFRLPSLPTEMDKHDWYCFECHQGGEIVRCSKCYRVFHPKCINAAHLPSTDAEAFLCGICKKRLQQRSAKDRLGRDELNTLLKFIVVKLKERLSMNLLERVISTPATKFVTDRSSQVPNRPEGPPVHPACEPWRAQLLLHHQMDVNTMNQKTQDLRYKTTFDFEIDAMTIVHNVVIYHGVHSNIADLARLMLRDCQRDITDLEQCKDCFKFSNEKDDKYWFCRPCNPPHTLVYAKQKGFPYWPAKIICVNENTHDVRFFGSQHQKAEIEKMYVKPISANIHSLQVKRTSAWNKACEELKKHQELLTEFKTNQTEAHNMLQNSSSGSISKGLTPSPKKISSDFDNRLLQYDACPNDEEDKEDDDKPRFYKDKSEKSGTGDFENDRGDKCNISDYGNDELSVDQGSSVSSTSRLPSKIRKKEPQRDDIVSSSCQELPTRSLGIQTSPRLIKMMLEEKGSKKFKEKERALRELAEKLRQEYENKDQKVLQNTIKQMEKDVERVKEDYKNKISDLKEKHKQTISEIKKKQWCWTCESEAIYHCCWNTAYCSIECQQLHWHREHKKQCRRQR